MVPRENKNNAFAKFEGTNEEYFGIFRNGLLGPVHTKTIVNENDSKRKLFYAFRPSVHTKTMKTLTVNA